MNRKDRRARDARGEGPAFETLVLNITPELHDMVKELVAKAEANVIPFEVMYARAEAARNGFRPKDPNADFTIFYDGWQYCYTHENHSKGVPLRHLSVSCPHQFPPAPACGTIMSLFGFVNPLVNVKVWMEQIGDNHYAVNMVEPIDGDWENLKGTIQ
jgi:hypothetical protein